MSARNASPEVQLIEKIAALATINQEIISRINNSNIQSPVQDTLRKIVEVDDIR
jgi:hypothetical protein